MELAGDTRVAYDYLAIATGPKLAVEEVPGFGPAGYTDSICGTDHAAMAGKKFEEFVQNPVYSNIYAVGVCVAMPPVTPTPTSSNWS